MQRSGVFCVFRCRRDPWNEPLDCGFTGTLNAGVGGPAKVRPWGPAGMAWGRRRVLDPRDGNLRGTNDDERRCNLCAERSSPQRLAASGGRWEASHADSDRRRYGSPSLWLRRLR